MGFCVRSTALLKITFSNGTVCRRTAFASAALGIKSTTPPTGAAHQVRHASTKKATKNAARPHSHPPVPSLVANHMPIQASQLKNVEGIQGRIRSIIAEVLEARLVVDCLKESIRCGRNLLPTEYDAILSQYGDHITGFVRNFTTIADFTQEKAKAELKDAEVKLEKAKAELKEAKAELKDAEVKLNYSQTYGDEGDIDSVLAQSKYLSLTLLASSKAKDMIEFADFIKDVWEERLKNSRFKQYSKAIVLQSASGVGKTYASIAMTYPLFLDSSFQYFPIAVYMGLNTMCPLTQEETNRLKDMGESGLNHVLLRRLLIQLNYLASPDVKIDESLWDKETGVQKMPVPAKRWDVCSLHFGSSVKDRDLESKLTSLLATIAKKARKPILLFPIVDEGQFLDKICPKDDTKFQGARWALRLLRSLQEENDVMGMMTGIDPVVHIISTHGTNQSYQKALHDPTGFTEIAKALLHSRNYTDSQVARIAAAYYPIVRDLEVVAGGGCPNPCSLDTETDDSKERAASLLLASGLRLWVNNFAWTADVPAMFSYTQTGWSFLPTLGIRHVAAAARGLGGLPCDVDFMAFAGGPESKSFESVTSFCLSMLLVLTNYKLKNSQFTMKLDLPVLEWLTTNVKLSFKTTIYPQDSTKAYFPSSLYGCHGAAFEVNKKDTPRLHRAFNLDMLENVGDTVLMDCRGSAPVDMIYVTLTKEGDGKSRGKLHIRLCDAKLVTSPTNRVGGINAMPKRFDLVKEYLEYHLEEEMNYEKPVFSKHAIITTATGDTIPDGMIAISPATCKFAPITDWWFACAPKGGNATS